MRACVRACVCACVCVFVHKPFFRQYFTFISSHLSLNCEVCWGTTDDLANSFLHFHCSPLAPWDLATSRPVHFLMLSSQLFLCLPCLVYPSTVPCKMVLARPDERGIFHLRLSLNPESTTDIFTTSFLHFSLFSTALWDLAISRPVHFPMLSSHLFFCLPGISSPPPPTPHCALQDGFGQT